MIKPYQRVWVEFGEKKTVGIVYRIVDSNTDPNIKKKPIGKLKDVLRIIDQYPILNEDQLKIADFMAKHYICNFGQAIFRIIPSARLERIFLNEDHIARESADLLPEMLPGQKKIINDFNLANSQSLKRVQTHLIFGITGSGKTRIYLELINARLKEDVGVILLLPEIALTYQFLNILKPYYGEKMVTFHSNLTPGERLSSYRRLQRGNSMLVVGTRSAVFAPVKNLGLIIIDEEHDPSFKENKTPRYYAKRIAWFRLNEASLKQKKNQLVLGSATPSVESFYACLNKKIFLHRLKKRATGLPLPKIHLISHSIFSEHSSIFSGFLLKKMTEHLKRGHQILLLLNRRGYSNYAFCPRCKESISCKNCSVSMSHHQSDIARGKPRPHLKCHLCGFENEFDSHCPKCSQPLSLFGKGIQKIDDALEYHFPGLSYARLDQDTAREKNYIQDILKALHLNELKILVGTQMIAKGFDLPRVTLVGIVNADVGLNLPDFRAFERVSQVLIQAAGRAGRHSSGEVVMQTMQTNHPTMEMTASYRYEDFLKQELLLRKHTNFPPFCKMLRILLKSKDEKELIAFCRGLENFLHVKSKEKDIFGNIYDPIISDEILGPTQAAIPKINNEYRYQILLKDNKEKNIQKNASIIKTFIQKKRRSTIRVEIDVNPLDLL